MKITCCCECQFNEEAEIIYFPKITEEKHVIYLPEVYRIDNTDKIIELFESMKSLGLTIDGYEDAYIINT